MMSAEAVKRGIVKTSACSTVSRLLKEAKIKPHLSRYWLNQVEIWFSILVGRLLKRASFNSIEELHQALINFI